jgi:hypothetical protein
MCAGVAKSGGCVNSTTLIAPPVDSVNALMSARQPTNQIASASADVTTDDRRERPKP